MILNKNIQETLDELPIENNNKKIISELLYKEKLNKETKTMDKNATDVIRTILIENAGEEE